MGITSISWSHYTFNPWEGCEKISPACAHCYAAERDGRFHGAKHWGKHAPRLIRTREEYWRQPLKWNREAMEAGERRRVFAISLGDTFERRPDLAAPRARLFDLVEETPYLDWLMVTKRPENIRPLVPGDWIARPRPNVWYLATVETMDYINRITMLRGVPAAVRGLSIEPILARMDLFHYLDGIDWVIVGGESGRSARPTYMSDLLQVIYSVDNYNHLCSGSVALWVKQLGSRPESLVRIESKGKLDKHEDIARFPEWARRRELPQLRRYAA